MWHGRRVAVIIPAYREARLLPATLAGVPEWVDRIVVVDDGSDDGTAQAAESSSDSRVVLLRHSENRGVGTAIVTGYRQALQEDADLLSVMAGDNQMDPGDLPALLDAVLGGADYAKGNRLLHPRARDMPLTRRIAGRILAFATRSMTGLSIGDSQCGFSVLSAGAARRLPLEELFPGYGYPNDLLGMLAAKKMTVTDVPVRPVYADEESGIKAWHALRILWILVRRRFKTLRSSRARRPYSAVT
jgi:glycosyltransferase involved in cell wall biosynthesis